MDRLSRARQPLPRRGSDGRSLSGAGVHAVDFSGEVRVVVIHPVEHSAPHADRSGRGDRFVDDRQIMGGKARQASSPTQAELA